MPRPAIVRSFSSISAVLSGLFLLGGCATLGKVMSPYGETFSCKNSDHGQCVDPQTAHDDAVVGIASRSSPAVTQDRTLLTDARDAKRRNGGRSSSRRDYQDSVYRELQALIDAPETPMLRPGRTVRTLILPYADGARPDRLYMPRFVYSVLDRPQWVVGDYLVSSAAQAGHTPILGQVRERAGETEATAPVAAPITTGESGR